MLNGFVYLGFLKFLGFFLLLKGKMTWKCQNIFECTGFRLWKSYSYNFFAFIWNFQTSFKFLLGFFKKILLGCFGNIQMFVCCCFVLTGDDPSEMDDESLNGDKSIMSMEEDASGAGSPSPSPWPEHPTQSIKEERHPEETAAATASTEESETTNDVHSTNLKRRRPADGSHSRGSESSESGVGGVGGIDASAHPAAALVASQPNLLSADLLQSLQYFALLRQSLPTNGIYSFSNLIRIKDNSS